MIFFNDKNKEMKNKIVLWGTNGSDERILVALELKIKLNKVSVYIFAEKVATDDFYSEMMEQWRDTKEPTNFTQEHQHLERELSITEGLLPDDIKVERTDIIQRAQTEWHFVILSSKLSEAYHNELQEIEEKIAGLKDFDKEVWDGLKTFWEKVQTQIRERTIFREHANTLRSRTDKGFEALKGMRSKMEEGFRKTSSENLNRFGSIIDDVEKRINENKHLSKVFEELKKVQKEIRNVDFTREHRNKLWNRVDKAFKEVKEKRFGKQEGGGGDSGPVQRLESRYNGLMNAIARMEKSIKHDENELAFQNRQIERTDGQLEAQIRQAKLKMIEQRVSSKQEKLDDMLKTKIQLEERIEREKEREATRQAKRAEEKARTVAKKKAKEKIAEDIKEKQASIEDTDDTLANAAQAINEQKSRGKKKTTSKKEKNTTENQEEKPPVLTDDSILSAIATTIGESLEDVVDTIKAVAEVVGDQIEEKVEEIKKEFTEVTSSDNEEE